MPDADMKKSAGKGAEEELFQGKIISCIGGIYTVASSFSGEEKLYPCSARGVFRHNGVTPVAGDNVKFFIEKGGKGCVYSVEERKNFLLRPPLSNLDVLFIVCAAASPDPSTLAIDKLSCLAHFHGIEPVVIVNKAELDPDSAENLKNVYEKCGHRVIVFSQSDHDTAPDLILPIVKGKVCAFAGVSGVGKSTIINAIFGTNALKTGELSLRLRRGRNTTRDSILYRASDDTYIADTPGFSLLDFGKYYIMSKSELPYSFMEFEKYIGKCRYTKCTHTVEEGCAVLDAVSGGDIPRSRHDSYLYLYECVKKHNEWDKKTL